jgi:hypothetical protein
MVHVNKVEHPVKELMRSKSIGKKECHGFRGDIFVIWDDYGHYKLIYRSFLLCSAITWLVPSDA